MTYNFDFDICALILIIVQLFSFYYKKNIPTIQNRVYLIMVSLVLLATLADISTAVISFYMNELPFWIPWMANYLFFIFLNLLPAVYSFYIITITDNQMQLLKKTNMVLYLLPLLITIGILLVNPFTGCIFYFDSAMVYHRGPALYVLYVLAGYYFVYGVVYATIYRDIIPLSKRIALYSFFIVISASVSVQSLFPHLLVEMMAISVCTLLVFLTIQNPEEIIHSGTGLFNREALLTMANVSYRNKVPFYVISARITNYEYFKRTFGVNTMSEVGRQITRRLKRLPIRRKQLYCVEAGHFAVVVPSSGIDDELPNTVKNLIEDTMHIGKIEFQLSGQILVISSPMDAETVESLLEYIDFPERDDERENPIVMASQLRQSGTSRIIEIERAVENALAKESFEVYYQPIYSTAEGSVRSAEALIRLYDEKLGYIPPDEFIPITEKNGTILQVGMFVFRSVCQFLAENNMKARNIDFIEVNLSVVQCMQSKLAEELLRTMQEFHLPADCINLEITETAAAYSTEALEANMRTLAASGITFSLDDYGTGYSNMSYMVELPFHIVKVDKSIISGMQNERTFIAVSSTVAMLKKMNLRIVAEGVETKEQAQILSDMGCDFLQGYYFSKPVPASQFLEAFPLVSLAETVR